jgi:hypothetical protein
MKFEENSPSISSLLTRRMLMICQKTAFLWMVSCGTAALLCPVATQQSEIWMVSWYKASKYGWFAINYGFNYGF